MCRSSRTFGNKWAEGGQLTMGIQHFNRVWTFEYEAGEVARELA